MFGWSLILRCYEIFPNNNNIFFHLKKVLSSCPLTSLSCTLKLPVTVWQALFGFASRNESNYSMGFGLMANTFCYYLRNIEHVPLISGSFKKSNRKTEPNLPKYLCAAVPRDVLKSSPQLPLRSRVPVLEHVGLLLGSAGMLGPEAKCDSAQGKSLPLGSRPLLGGGGSHREFSFKRSQILILKHVSCAKGELRSLKKWLFPSWPLPPRCFSTGFGLVCFTRKKHSQQEQCVVSFGLMSWAGPGEHREEEQAQKCPLLASLDQQINLVFVGLELRWPNAAVIKLHQRWGLLLSLCPTGAFRGPNPPSQLPWLAHLYLLGVEAVAVWLVWQGELQIQFNRGISGGCGHRGLTKANVSW